MSPDTPALTTAEVARLAGLSVFTLHSWVRSGRVSPSVAGPRGKLQPLWWSVTDAVEVRTVAELRRTGISGQRLRRVHDTLVDRGASFASSRLLVVDDTVVLVGADGVAEVVDTHESTGQTTLVVAEDELVDSATTVFVVHLDRIRRTAESVARPAGQDRHESIPPGSRRAG